MALTESQQKVEFTVAPEFSLQNPLAGKVQSLQELKGERATVIVFMCNHCPYVKHILPKLLEVSRDFKSEGVNFIAVNSNNFEQYPEDSPEHMANIARAHNFPFPYLLDENQNVAKEYGAECTPEFFLLDEDLKCCYHGRFDDSTPKSGKPSTGADLKSALNCLLVGKQCDFDVFPSMGCNIKWK
ncbi:MAG: thioredoxin family protein [Luteibaculaceae bacterium]